MIFGIVIIILIAGSLVYRYYRDLTSLAPLGSPGKPVVILAIGLDVNYNIKGEPIDDKRYADIGVLCFLDDKRKRVTLLEIPGDAYFHIPGEEAQTLSYTYLHGGLELTKETVEKLLNIEVDYTAEMNYEGFIQFIDSVGGVQVEIAENIEFKDTLGGFNVTIPKGLQRLSGVEALQYVRYITDIGGSIERIGRQQKLIKGLADEIFSTSNITRLPRIAEAAFDMVETDISFKDALKMVAFLERIKLDDIEVRAVPVGYDDFGIEIDLGRLHDYMKELY